MNRVDLALALLLAVCALRGYWRGLFRECFGLLALLAGVTAAFEFTALGSGWLQQYLRLPTPLQTGASFVVIFVLVHTTVNLLGVLVDRLASALLLGGINGLAGAVLGASKGVAVLAFVLLFLHLFPIFPILDGDIMRSTIGRPLVTAASNLIRLSSQTAAQPDAPSKT